ncbi:ectonucleoside triphosphate diphosphohydrolase 8-like isoform X1 [Acipenser ruthenus]|nr:ectonucleoside triphosphate diphosphohydrolase 8-like [Acipenser ruthenus]XP_058844939.1 ectonucleoside triphosphate diphosphohydrolase 8-like isoform X1 [Acipenser ruthenus]
MIGSYPFKFQGARILSGVEEGAYGWITINYLLSSFIKYSYEGKRLHPKNGKILGALDMGGASTQITFTPEGRIADKQTEAFSAFFYTFDFLKLAPRSSLDVTKKTTEEFCKRDWSSLKTDFPTEKENNLREYCATSYYITTLLADAYKFDNQSWNKIVFEKKADDTDICWMLGYTLNLTNLIPTETPAR